MSLDMVQLNKIDNGRSDNGKSANGKSETLQQPHNKLTILKGKQLWRIRYFLER